MEAADKKRTGLVIAGIMLGILVAALDSNIVSTAMPKIIGSLNGMELYNWPVTAYLLAMTISMPLFGKLSDVYGFKPVYLFGIAVFLAGSVLCGLAQDMMQFIVFRGMQGIGGAILIANAIAVVGILFEPADRAKYGGFVSAASGVASVIGPFAGGLITDSLGWRWVFFINIPLGLVALAFIAAAFPKRMQTGERKPVDVPGAAVLAAALVPLLLALTWGGGQYAWNSFQIIGLFIASGAMFFVFRFTESRAKDPIIPLDLFKNAVFNFSAVQMFLFNGVLMVAIIMIPLFMQGVRGVSAGSSGALITPMMVSLIVGVMACGIIVSKTCKYKLLSILGFAAMLAGIVWMAFFNADTSEIQVIASMIIMGLGAGVEMSIFNVTAQNVFPNSRMGTVTSSIQFFRTMGQTIFSSVSGTMLGFLLSSGIGKLDTARFPAEIAQQLKSPDILTNTDALGSIQAHMPASLADDLMRFMAQAKQVLCGSIQQIFIACAVITAASLVIAFFMKEVPFLKKDNDLLKKSKNKLPKEKKDKSFTLFID